MPPPREILEDLHHNQQMSLRAIATYFKVCCTLPGVWFKKYQIPIRKTNTPDAWNSKGEEIRYLYHQERMSLRQIADYYETGELQIRNIMKRMNIPTLGRGRRKGADNHQWKDGKSSRAYRKVIVKTACNHCGTKENLGIHHKNNDHYDNQPENLEVLCNSCHMSETMRARLEAKRLGIPYKKSNGTIGWRPHHSKNRR